MIKIETFSFNPFQENTYVASDPTGECVIIDAGNYSAIEDKTVLEYINKNRLKPIMALNTHGHIDHILGVPFVKETFEAPFALHGEDKFLVESAPSHAAIYGFSFNHSPEVDIDIKENKTIKFGESELELFHTPGHTPGHVCILDRETNSLFTGDTLFKESIGRTDLPGGDYSWIMKSILEVILPLGPEITIYPGHGPKSSLGHEALYNPFIVEVIRGEVNAR